MNLYIFKYNNYYNRKVKKENILADYGEPVHIIYDCKDFSPNDGVNTEHIFGSAANNYNGSGDYLIVADENYNIVSRWFIIETNFTRAGQWNILLRRDLVVDYYDVVINAPCFIEKATLNSESPFVFNMENMVVNQIKTSEDLLMDETKTPWLVGYYSKTVSTLTGTVPTNEIIPGSIVLTTPIQNWDYYKYCAYNGVNAQEQFKGEIQAASYEIWYDGLPLERDSQLRIDYLSPYDCSASKAGLGVDNGSSLNALTTDKNIGTAVQRALTDNNNYLGNKLKQEVFGQNLPINIPTTSQINEFKDLNGKIVQDSNGKRFRVSFGTTSIEHLSADITAGAAYETLTAVVNKANELSWVLNGAQGNPVLEGSPNNKSFHAGANVTAYTLQLTDISELEGSITYEIKSDKITTEDAPWNIFAIPFGKVSVLDIQEGTSSIPITERDIGFRTAAAILEQHPVEVYDIQLLPYCPFENVDEFGNILITSDSQYGTVKKDDRIIGVILNIRNSKFSKTLTQYNKSFHSTAIEKKLHNECDKWRLTAPNYSNYFDFSVEKNLGINGINIDCEYKPYQPYIHVNPIFNGLYGYDDNSPRGLICGGDYSIHGIVQQWQEYQLQNKNFQLTFDRQIQNMELQQSIQRRQEQWQIGVGSVQGGVAGATTGSMIGGGWGAAIGGVIGLGTSFAGGIADVRMNEQLRTEALDYTKDMFGYQLGNIQALPNTISKISSLNNNNKIFPILEFYTCTEEEKEAFLNKVAWNGMSVGAIGTIENYIENEWSYNNITSKGYIKGQIIRMEDLEDEFHLLKEISNEIYKGVYF